MSSRAGWRLTATSVVLALISSLLLVTPAFADGDPPSPDPVVSTEEGGDVSDWEDGAGLVDPSELEGPAVEPTPAILPDASTETAPGGGSESVLEFPAEAPPDGLLAEVPDGTTVAVLNEDGNPLPLASAAAAEILAAADPVWCPKDVMPGSLSCSPSFSSLAELVAGFVPNNNGVIWIQGGADASAGGVVISGSGNWAAAASYNLALRGGWDGPGTTTINTDNPSLFSTNLAIVDWNAEVVVRDIVISAAPGDPALVVTTAGGILVSRVTVEGNAGLGARLDNTSGAANLHVLRSRFSGNGGDGLVAISRGVITLMDVVATGNTGRGTVVDNSGALSAKGVMIATGNEFSVNSGDGLQAYSRGTITMKEVTAVGNGGNGVLLDNRAGSAMVSLTGVNVFCENGLTGLNIQSDGAIAAGSIVANANGDHGAVLENSGGSSSPTVKLTGTNEFKGNGFGLSVVSNGAVTLSNVVASGNVSGYGADLRNNLPGFSGNVSLVGINVFSGNYGTGLVILSYGSISGSSVTAERNGLGGSAGFGAVLDNSGAVTAKPVTLAGTNTFRANYSGGLLVDSKGSVLLSKVTASESVDGFGAYIINTYGPTTSAQSVTLSGAATFSGNDKVGLEVYSYGAISIANLTASYNGLTHGGGASLYNRNGAATVAVTLTGTCTLDGNGGTGLDVDSRGAITISNLLARSNKNMGVWLINAQDGVTSPVTVTGTSEFAGNGYDGLGVNSRGNITLQNFDAYENGGSGIGLVNAIDGAVANVTVGTSTANWCNGLWENDYHGMGINSAGTVTLWNICAWDNGDPLAAYPYGHGVRVGSDLEPARAVTLNGTNRFDGNLSGGLLVYSLGPITANNLSANGNLGEGAYLYNAFLGVPPANMLLKGTNQFSSNYFDGLVVLSLGGITVSNLTAVENGLGGGGDGAYLDNYLGAATSPRSVTLSGLTTVSGNGSGGLVVHSLGAITASNLRAEGNLWGDGATLNNAYGTPTTQSGGVALLGSSNRFSGNAGYGLQVSSYGAINIVGLRAEGNGGVGAVLENAGAAVARPVTLSGKPNHFSSNAGNGLEIRSKGAVTVSSLQAVGNGGFGAVVDDSYSGPSSPQNVILKGSSNFTDNGLSGLEVYSFGAITLSSVRADGNGVSGSGQGVRLDNYLGVGTLARAITLTGTNTFVDNAGDGLHLLTLGAITANNLTAGRNLGDGAYLQNQWDALQSNVTLSGSSAFEGNGSDGLVVFSNGAITLSNVTATGNGGDGGSLDTHGLLAPQKVTLTGTNTFSGNGDTLTHTGIGLEVRADGQITVSNLTASWNAASGAYLNNLDDWWSGLPGITLTGTNAFSGNFDDGLYFDAVGPIRLSKLTADGNGGSGVVGSTSGDVLFACGSLTANGAYGWYLSTPGIVTLKGVFSYGNGINSPAYPPLPGGGTLVVYRTCS